MSGMLTMSSRMMFNWDALEKDIERKAAIPEKDLLDNIKRLRLEAKSCRIGGYSSSATQAFKETRERHRTLATDEKHADVKQEKPSAGDEKKPAPVVDGGNKQYASIEASEKGDEDVAVNSLDVGPFNRRTKEKAVRKKKISKREDRVPTPLAATVQPNVMPPVDAGVCEDEKPKDVKSDNFNCWLKEQFDRLKSRGGGDSEIEKKAPGLSDAAAAVPSTSAEPAPPLPIHTAAATAPNQHFISPPSVLRLPSTTFPLRSPPDVQRQQSVQEAALQLKRLAHYYGIKPSILKITRIVEMSEDSHGLVDFYNQFHDNLKRLIDSISVTNDIILRINAPDIGVFCGAADNLSNSIGSGNSDLTAVKNARSKPKGVNKSAKKSATVEEEVGEAGAAGTKQTHLTCNCPGNLKRRFDGFRRAVGQRLVDAAASVVSEKGVEHRKRLASGNQVENEVERKRRAVIDEDDEDLDGNDNVRSESDNTMDDDEATDVDGAVSGDKENIQETSAEGKDAKSTKVSPIKALMESMKKERKKKARQRRKDRKLLEKVRRICSSHFGGPIKLNQSRYHMRVRRAKILSGDTSAAAAMSEFMSPRSSAAEEDRLPSDRVKARREKLLLKISQQEEEAELFKEFLGDIFNKIAFVRNNCQPVRVALNHALLIYLIRQWCTPSQIITFAKSPQFEKSHEISAVAEFSEKLKESSVDSTPSPSGYIGVKKFPDSTAASSSPLDNIPLWLKSMLNKIGISNSDAVFVSSDVLVRVLQLIAIKQGRIVSVARALSPDPLFSGSTPTTVSHPPPFAPGFVSSPDSSADSIPYLLIKLVSRNRQYGCVLCPYVTSVKAKFILHLRCHQKADLFECGFCCYQCPSQEFLSEHIREVHSRPNPNLINLQEFHNFKFKSKSSADALHLFTHFSRPPSDTQPFFEHQFPIKKQQQLSNSNSSSFSNSAAAAPAAAAFNCAKCGFSSPYKHSYESHLFAHTRLIGRHVCDGCAFSTSTLQLLKAHLDYCIIHNRRIPLMKEHYQFGNRTKTTAAAAAIRVK